MAWYITGMDFADALHLAQCQQAEQLLTFDKRFVKSAKKNGSAAPVTEVP